MEHTCENVRLTEDEFEKCRRALTDKLTDIITECQDDFKGKDICESDFFSLLSSFALDHVINTMKFIVNCEGISMGELTARVIKKILIHTGGQYIDGEMIAAQQEKKFSTIN